MGKLIANLGSEKPFSHGGFFVYDNGIIDVFEEGDRHGLWKVFQLDNDIPADDDWFMESDDLDKAAKNWGGGTTGDALRALLTDQDQVKRAEGYQILAAFYNCDDFDEDGPLILSDDDIERRYADDFQSLQQVKPGKYDSLTDEDFRRILEDVMDESDASALLSIPGVYEAVSEHFNNEVLERWGSEQAEVQS